MPASFGSVRRSRLLVGAVSLGVLAAVAAVVLTRGTSPGSPSRATTTTATQRTTTTTRTTPSVTPVGTYSVATTSLTVTVPGTPATDAQLPTTVWYPVPKSTVDGAAPRSDPLLVFSQGFDEPVASYLALITDWASAGFVVAGPTYPHTAPSTPTTLDRADLVHHPADLRAVIAAVIDQAQSPGSILSGKVDGSEVGLVGQSDGGDVSLAAADNSCCRIDGVKAAAILSGAEYPNFGGRYFALATASGPSLLVVQGSNDTINPPVCSAQFYDVASPPKFYLDLLDATHLGPYTEDTPWESVVAAVTTEFFDAELAGERSAIVGMATSGNVPGVAALTTGPTAPPATGTCGPTA